MTTYPTLEQAQRHPGVVRCHFNGTGWNAYEAGDNMPATPATAPGEVTMRQARLALLEAGLLDAVTTAIDGLSEPAKTAARIEWEYSQTVQRHRGLVAQVGTALGLSAAQLDALFTSAAAK